MANYHDGVIPFVYREEFDYLDYLKEQSHFDSVSFQIDDSISRLIFSNEAINQGVMSSLSSLEQGLGELADISREGFKGVNIRLNTVNENLENIFHAIEDGFAETTRLLESINSTLDELLKVAKTPEQNWAEEQFSIARDIFDKGFYEESLTYLDRAINGYRDRLGYKFDHRLHMLLGLIYMGNKKNIDPKIVNLSKARQAFREAAKYAISNDKSQEVEMQRAKIEALQMAGWADYCLGNFVSSIESYKNAIGLDTDNPKTWYYLAKVQFHIHDIENANVSFKRAIDIDPKYSLKAGGDADFMAHESHVVFAISQLQIKYFNMVEPKTPKVEPYCLPKVIQTVSKYDQGMYGKKMLPVEKIRSFTKTTDLVSLAKANDTLNNLIGACPSLIENTREQIRNRVKNVGEQADSVRQRKNKNIDNPDNGKLIVAMWISPFLLLLVVGPLWSEDPGSLEWIISFVIYLIVSSAVLQFAYSLILKPWLRASYSRSRSEDYSSASKPLEDDLAVLSRL